MRSKRGWSRRDAVAHRSCFPQSLPHSSLLQASSDMQIISPFSLRFSQCMKCVRNWRAKRLWGKFYLNYRGWAYLYSRETKEFKFVRWSRDQGQLPNLGKKAQKQRKHPFYTVKVKLKKKKFKYLRLNQFTVFGFGLFAILC